MGDGNDTGHRPGRGPGCNPGNDQTQLQFERLQSTLNRAYRNVPFHRNRQNQLAAKTGQDPSILDSPADLARLPFMTRRDLAEHYPYGLFAVPLRGPATPGRTCRSGGRWSPPPWPPPGWDPRTSSR
ncbi:MAG: hypothetical protein ACOC98_00590 [Thermodesulfobacteriota bacterium]